MGSAKLETISDSAKEPTTLSVSSPTLVTALVDAAAAPRGRTPA